MPERSRSYENTRMTSYKTQNVLRGSSNEGVRIDGTRKMKPAETLAGSVRQDDVNGMTRPANSEGERLRAPEEDGELERGAKGLVKGK